MAVVKNRTADTLALFSPDAPPVDPGGEVTVSDERFAERAWPKETWDLVTPPEGYVDESTEDAHLFVPKPEKPPAKKTAAKKTTAKGEN